MKLQISATLLRCAPLLALCLGSACMLSPSDGQVVANRSTPVSFHGFHTIGNRPLNIRALNDNTGVFDTLDTAVSSSSAYTVDGQDMFEWSRSGIVIPNEYWDRGGCQGFEATVQTRDAVSNYAMISVEEDWGQCWNDVNADIGRFVTECAAPNSPNAIIRTEDFLERPPASAILSDEVRGVVYDECNRVEILFQVTPGQYEEVEAIIYNGTNTQFLPCTLDSATGNARCRIEFGPDEIAESWEDFTNAGHDTGLRISHRALDQLSCLPSRIWTQETEWQPVDTFERAGNSSPTCFSGGPDEPMDPGDPDMGTWWDVGCICTDATATVPVALNSCLQVGASSPVTGASLMCGYAANDLRWATGLATTCVVDSLMDTGAGPCWPGAWSIESIGS